MSTANQKSLTLGGAAASKCKFKEGSLENKKFRRILRCVHRASLKIVKLIWLGQGEQQRLELWIMQREPWQK